MPSIYQLKPVFQNLLRPLVSGMYKLGIQANHVTLAAMLLSVGLSVGLYCYYSNHAVNYWILLFPIWMLIRMAFNAIDGMLAREFSQQSDLGAFLNELCDVISDTALYICLIVISPIQVHLLLLLCFLAVLTEFTGVTATLIHKPRCYAGPMGKSDRAFWLSAITIMLLTFELYGLATELQSLIINGLLAIISILCIWTVINRIRQSLA